MATLEKIRSKSVMLFIVIIVALLAFIMGDFLTSGRSFFGNDTTMIKAGSAKIDNLEYQKAMNQVSKNQQNQRQDNDELQQIVLDQLLMEKLVDEQIDKLGVKITDKEISTIMTKMPYGPAAQFIGTAAQYLNLPQTADGSMVYDAIINPGKYNLTTAYTDQVAQQVFGQPTMVAAWSQMEEDAEKMMRQRAFSSLLGGLFNANDLDAQAYYNDNLTKSVVTYTTKAIGADEVDVTDADLKAKWNELKPAFKLPEETRAVDYIVVNIRPSQADLQAAEAEVDETVAALNEQPGLDALSGRGNFVNETVTSRLADVKKNADLRLLPDSALAAGKVHKFNLNRGTNTFTIAKVLDVAPQVDSVNISFVRAFDQAEADSLMQVIAGGQTMADIAANMDPRMAMQDQWMSLVNEEAKLKDALAGNPVGQNFVYADSIQGLYGVFIVNERRAPVEYADIAVIKYTVDPSPATVTDLKSQLNSFVASNSKGDLFSANADSLYHLMHADVTARSPHLGNLANSRKAVKWTMDAKPGQVSKVFEDRDYYLVVALKDIYANGYLPYTALTDQLTAAVTADKLAAKAIEQYAGKANTVADYAQLMGGEVRTDSAIVFTSSRAGALGPGQYAIQGAIAGAQDGAVVGPIKGNNEVVVFQVLSRNTEGRPFNATQDRNMFMNAFRMNDMNALFLGNRKVKDYTLDHTLLDD